MLEGVGEKGCDRVYVLFEKGSLFEKGTDRSVHGRSSLNISEHIFSRKDAKGAENTRKDLGDLCASA
jgi:hypothetical protein